MHHIESSSLTHLPEELLLAIFAQSVLSLKDLYHLLLTSKDFNRIAQAEDLWEARYTKLIANTNHESRGRLAREEIRRFFLRMADQSRLDGAPYIKEDRNKIASILLDCYENRIDQLTENDLALLGRFIRGCVLNHKPGILPYIDVNRFSKNQLINLFTLTKEEKDFIFSYELMAEKNRATTLYFKNYNLKDYEEFILFLRQFYMGSVWPLEKLIFRPSRMLLGNTLHYLMAISSTRDLTRFLTILPRLLPDHIPNIISEPVIFPLSPYINQENTEFLFNWLQRNYSNDMPRVAERTSGIISSGAIPSILEAFYPYIPANDLATHKAKQLDMAVISHHPFVIRLLKSGVSFSTNDQVDNALMHAAYDGNLEMIKVLFPIWVQDLNQCSNSSYYFTRNKPNKPIKGLTALMAAVIGKRAHVVKWLLEQGADPNVITQSAGKEVNALSFAIKYKDINTFLALLASPKIDINLKVNEELAWANLFDYPRSEKGEVMLQTLIRHNCSYLTPELKVLCKKIKNQPDWANEKVIPHLAAEQQSSAQVPNVHTKKIRDRIAELEKYGKSVNAEKQERIIELVRLLNEEISFFEKALEDSPEDKEQAYKIFSEHMQYHLNSHNLNSVLYAHRAAWKPILWNIFIAVITCGIGLLAIVGKIFYITKTEPVDNIPKYPTGTHFLFFGQTATQNKMADIEQAVTRCNP